MQCIHMFENVFDPTCHFVLKPFLQTSQCSGYSELCILRWRRRVRSSLKLLSHWLQWKLFSCACTCTNRQSNIF